MRITILAIGTRGDVQPYIALGDARALQSLRERMTLVSKEHYALVVAIGKLKKKPRTK